MRNEQSYQNLLRQRAKLVKELGRAPFVLRGSLREHGNRCGKPGCICKHPVNPKPHGPYHYLSHRHGDKTQTIFLNKKKLCYAKDGIEAYGEMLNALYELSEVNFRILRYHYDKLKDKR